MNAQPSPRSRVVIIGGVALVLLGAGWFFLSHLVMNKTVPDAIGEALGAMLGVLVVLSVVGAIVSSRGR